VCRKVVSLIPATDLMGFGTELAFRSVVVITSVKDQYSNSFFPISLKP